MFNRRDKIIKKDGAKPSDLEEEVAKSLHQLELNNKSLKAHLSIIFINSVENVDYEQDDGAASQYLLVRIPHRSLGAYRKVGTLVQEHLEQQYEKPVLIVANRTIISPSGKCFLCSVNRVLQPSTTHLKWDQDPEPWPTSTTRSLMIL